MVFFSSRISPFTSTAIFLERSPLATAVVTSAILRTWAVKFPAIELTLSVRSFQVPATPRTSAWPPNLPSVPTSRATRVTSEAKELSWSTIVLMVSFSSSISPRTATVIFFDKITFCHRGRHRRDIADLSGKITRHQIHVVSEIFPSAGDTFHFSLAAEFPFGAHLTSNAGDFRSERPELVNHRVDGVFQFQDLAAHIDRDFFRQVSVGHRRGDLPRYCALGR